ncbi:hypothetical protein L916_05018 [Phytophthora nicotianae]|uniref:Uncharacterized protein n=1 Tax=Phytophthora nicotianae TaxID=4792 RepID=W2JE80_PHYNI|nr:hypothetical protein L916_05018 [Phytophthora nicotianae]
MPRGTAKGGAKPHTKVATRKEHAKSFKRHSTGSAVKELLSRLPSMSPDDRTNPRFACREHIPGCEDEAMDWCFYNVSKSCGVAITK